MRKIALSPLSFLCWRLLLLLAFSCLGVSANAVDKGGYVNPKALFSAEEIKVMQDKNEIKIVDARGSDKYQRGHIVSALDLGVGSFDTNKDGLSMMYPNADKFASMLGREGINKNDFVVFYDDMAGMGAARLAWMFKYFGHDKVAIFDGTLNNWKGGVTGQKPEIKQSNYPAKIVQSDRLASFNEVKSAIGKQDVIILDARSPAEFSGETGTGRLGHIPGSVNVDWVSLMNADKTVKDVSTLKKLLAAKGITPDKKIITYCRSGYRASYVAYVLKELLGYPKVALYDGSWIEWGGRMDAPVEK